MKALTTHILDDILHRSTVTKNSYVGTFPACMIPKSNKAKYSFITNSESHEKPGEHWNAWVVNGNRAIFFDSFGRPPLNVSKEYRHFLDKFDIHWVTSRVQAFGSPACGYYCIHFIYLLSLGFEVKDFLDEYSNDYLKNDKTVYNIVNTL